jgi:hypothetical protein
MKAQDDKVNSHPNSIKANYDRLRAIALADEARELDRRLKEAYAKIGHYNNLSSIGNYYGSLSSHKPKNSLISRIIKLLKDIWNGE